MTHTQLQVFLIVDAIIIAVYAVASWLADYSPLSLAIAIVAGMTLQIIAVVSPRRARRNRAATPSDPTD